ncbi:hypothetical protein ACFQ3R_07895 [Mesonia ostreae]|uniref:Uncharacterized protein n=1 Tax=Mesonia ostreae TaxID=861110 RepID=A0ABU2KFH3_9FLAO|nr:hypothetical protein [Mesonia ostreae]MDT0293408.1 hypothetical protein [Mesonia ostreae]
MLLKFSFVLFLMCSVSQSKAQALTAQIISETPLTAEKFIGVDEYGNTYQQTKNILYKLEKEKKFQFSDLQLGKITSVDIINPLRITLFYRDMNTVIILDNRLNEITRVNFNNLPNFRTVLFATTAKNNSIWIFNTDLQQLELYDYQNQKIQSHSQPFNTQVYNLKSNFNFAWVQLENSIEMYNVYGSFIKEFEISPSTAFQVSDQKMITKNENGFQFLKAMQGKFLDLKISENDVKEFYLNNENLYIYNGKDVKHYLIH